VSLLAVSALTKRFGGVVANRDVSLEVASGELIGVIGPNGAGKSTLFDLITGVTRPDAGSVTLDGRDITRLRPDQISRLGVARTFQKLRPFAGMTVVENVMVGAFQATADVGVARAAALEALASVGLADRAEAHARVLSTGQRKRLELARALATGPRLLLLDEVMAGLTATETETMVELVRAINADGIAVLLIEHNMRAVMALSHRIVVLSFGERIAAGRPAEIARDPRVIAAYLGDQDVDAS
jgi:branched-chain amino acid transport system ATP-binding protein